MTDEQFEIHIKYQQAILQGLAAQICWDKVGVPAHIAGVFTETVQSVNQSYYQYDTFQKLKKGKK